MFAFLMGLKSISPAALNELLLTASATVIDVNHRNSWVRHHVPGAVHLDARSFDTAELPTDKQQRVVFYCSNPLCSKAPTAARRARQMGYVNAMVMSAGITGWMSAGLPVETAAPA